MLGPPESIVQSSDVGLPPGEPHTTMSTLVKIELAESVKVSATVKPKSILHALAMPVFGPLPVYGPLLYRTSADAKAEHRRQSAKSEGALRPMRWERWRRYISLNPLTRVRFLAGICGFISFWRISRSAGRFCRLPASAGTKYYPGPMDPCFAGAGNRDHGNGLIEELTAIQRGLQKATSPAQPVCGLRSSRPTIGAKNLKRPNPK